MSGRNYFSQQIIIFFHKDIDDDDYEVECIDFQDEFFNFEQILGMSRNNWIPKYLFLKRVFNGDAEYVVAF